MTGDKITIDDELLRKNTRAFLFSPAGQPVLETFDFPFIMCLVFALISCGLGICLLPTIVGTIAGLKSLWWVLKGEPFKEMYDNPKQKPEKLQPLLCHGIIIGPDQKHALVLGTFKPRGTYLADALARKAAFFGTLYCGGEESEDPAYESLFTLLCDDTYRANRRRRVPDEYTEGMDLLLFDVELDPQQGRETPYDTVLFAFVADYGEEKDRGTNGEIAAIPWYVVNDAVRISAL